MKPMNPMYRSRIDLIGQYIPVVISLLLTLTTSILGKYSNPIVTVVLSLFIIFTPGYYLSQILTKELNLDIIEFIVLDIILSGTVVMFLYLIATQFGYFVSRSILLIVLTVFITITSIIDGRLSSNSHTIRIQTREEVIKSLGLLTSFLLGLVVVSLYVPKNYWRGPDGWETVTIIREIADLSMGYNQAFDYFRTYVTLANSGFYHLLAAFHMVTGLSPESIMRYGGVLQTGFFTALLFVIFKKYLNLFPSLVGSFLVTLNPYLNTRFVVLLRENFSIYFLLLNIFLLKSRINTKNGVSLYYILITGLVTASCLVTHPMTPIILYGVLGIQILHSIYKNKKTALIEILSSILFSLVIAYPFVTKMTVPIYNFLQKSTLTLQLAIAGVVLIFVLCVYLTALNKNKLSILFTNQLFKISLGAALILMVFYSLINPPEQINSYFYGSMKLEQFSRLIIPFAVMGFIAFITNSTFDPLLSLTIVTIAFLPLSYFQVPIPLSRIGVHLAYMMSFYASYLLKTVENPEKPAENKTFTNIKEGFTYATDWIAKNKTSVILIAVFVIGGAIEYSDINPTANTFSQYDIVNVQDFIQDIQEQDLVISYGLSDHLLYYNKAPRENLVTDLSTLLQLKEFYQLDTPTKVSQLIEDINPSVKRVTIFMSITEEYNLKQLPVFPVLEDFFIRVPYRNFVSYTMRIPLKTDEIELSKIKYIEDTSPEPIVPSGSQGSWDQNIIASSNCIYSPWDEQRPYKIYFIAQDQSDLKQLGYAYSIDGKIWEKHDESLIRLDVNQLYIVTHSEKYYLFTESQSKTQILRLESQDGLNWFNETITLDSSNSHVLRFYESPVVWLEDENWNMIIWETSLGDMLTNKPMLYKSIDGVQWENSERSIKWIFYDETHRQYEYYKILFTDVIKLEDQYFFLGKIQFRNQNLQIVWQTGSIHVPGNVTNKWTYLRSFVYKDHLEINDKIDSVHIIELDDGNYNFLFIEETGLTDGIRLGQSSDFSDIPENYMVKP
ncbi:MAG: hypothetical protein NWE89_04880 [Candidatus Bathyarchaeota archaeon]|nr:hypothetical protein [Candidatus Bathyarchaeota archaeon]